MDYKYKIITLLIYLSFSFPQVEKLNILNFNIHGFGSKKITKKVNAIINKIKDFDIIFIQENWVHNKLLKGSRSFVMGYRVLEKQLHSFRHDPELTITHERIDCPQK